MPIFPKIQALIERINQELDETEYEASRGLNLVRPLLAHFPDNDRLNQFFAYFSSVLFFVEITKTRHISTITERISEEEATLAEIQAVGEELSTLLGQVLDTKIAVKRLNNRLED